MPVNMDPKKRPKKPASEVTKNSEPGQDSTAASKFGDVTERDRELDLADAEWKNLWDQTEVIDMDKW